MDNWLNLPILNRLYGKERLLIVGIGSGFDVFAGLPIQHLLTSGKLDDVPEEIVFANFSDRKGFDAELAKPDDYPHGLLEFDRTGCKMWSLSRSGVQSLKDGLQKIIEAHNIDCMLLVDGGVDSLMCGDERDQGTVLEDFCVLAAASEIDLDTKILACLGFGTETDENLNHYRALENIAFLAKHGCFLGNCALTTEMQEFRYYKRECEWVWRNNRKSHVQTKVISAVLGGFEDNAYSEVDSRVYGGSQGRDFISPLMWLYWFFDLEGVTATNQVIEALRPSRTFTDALMLYRQWMLANPPHRTKEVLPL